MAIKSNFKTSLLLSLLAAALLLVTTPAFAQEEAEAEGVRYVVQPGDTLSSISVRFDVALNELIEANSLINPNNLNVGDVLVIPGIDWIEGTLVLQPLPIGEDYVSLKRRYLLSDADMARLNRFTSTSPEQIYTGFQVMLATEHGELTESARALVRPGVSLLELAVASGDSPWGLVAANQLAGTWAALPGDVLFTPGRPGNGPGGLPGEVANLQMVAPGFLQGATLQLNFDAPAGLTLSGEFAGYPLHFFRHEDVWVSLQGIPLDAVGERYSLLLSGTLPDGSPFAFAQPVRVAGAGYERANLTVRPELLDDQLNASELAYVAEIMSQVTPERLWERGWGWPHDLVNEITSGFGLFRTYNGGLASSYHTGVDFGGGALLAIYAPAPGRVVFAGPLDIRGNATILDHGWGVFTGYWHQAEIYVSVGDVVEPGQVLGIVGGTGRVNGPHLHWELWVGGVPVQPLDWLARTYP
ncbi:MAG: peptidoglycan DD-metalloendopeptidase family protein [Anaerolineales bacterium]|nr:peptidoglycan DD-metalloendopeptidase family protein [Anaerolineales bacterium]